MFSSFWLCLIFFALLNLCMKNQCLHVLSAFVDFHVEGRVGQYLHVSAGCQCAECQCLHVLSVYVGFCVKGNIGRYFHVPAVNPDMGLFSVSI